MLAGKKVLIVDDDIRNIFALTSVLEGYHMNIVSAETGRDAISILQSQPDIDVVLMDIMMPEMDGIDTMREIRKTPEIQDAADHRGDGQGHEGRPREVHRGRRLGLPVQAGGHRADAGGAAGGCTAEPGASHSDLWVGMGPYRSYGTRPPPAIIRVWRPPKNI